MKQAATGAVVLVFYTVVLAWLTWPLVSRISSHLPDAHGACRFDLLATTSFLAAEARNLAAAESPLAGGFYHPSPDPLRYAHLAVGAWPIFAPVFLATANPAAAANALFLLGLAVTATSLHLVARAWTASHVAGAVAALTFLTNRWTLWELVPTAPFYALLGALPPALALAAAPRPGWRWIIALAGWVWLQGSVDQAYIAPATLVSLGTLGLLTAAIPSRRRDGARLLGALAVAALALAPLYAPYLALRFESPELATQTVWGPSTAPVPLSRAFWGFLSPTSIAPAAALLIATGGVLRLLGSRARTPSHAWVCCLVVAAVSLVISLPREVTVLGIPIEPPWYDWLPALGYIRAPERLATPALVALCLLAGLALAECGAAIGRLLPERRARAAPVALACAVGLLAYRQYHTGFGGPAYARRQLPDAYPLQALPDSSDPVVRALSAGSGPVLELPLGTLDVLPPYHARAMYRAILHRRPLLNGYSSYYPSTFPRRMALASRLPDPAALAALRESAGLETILVQAAEIADPELRRAWLALAETGGNAELRLTARIGDTLVFEVLASPPSRGRP